MPAPPSQGPVQIGGAAGVAGAWQPPAPQQPQRRVRSEAAFIPAANAILSPLAGGIYAALTLSATSGLPGPWYARFEYATSADGYAAWTLIGNGATGLGAQPSTLAWALGPLDASLTYKVRFTPYDQSGAPGAVTTMAGTFRIDHVVAPTPTAPTEDSLLDTTQAQSFTWTFNDPDGGAQTAYALRRVRAADGLQEWWRASDSSWQSIETWNATATQSASIGAARWLPGAYAWSVATEDALGLPSPYSVARAVRFSSAVVPAITTPPAAGNLVTQGITVVWTAAEQAKYRVRLLTGGGFTTVLTDSGIVADAAARSYAVAGAANGATVRFELTTYNADGLASVVTRDKSVVYTGPTTPTAVGSTPVGPPLARLVITNPAGGDTFASNSVYRSDDAGVTYNLIASGLGVNATYDDYAVGAGKTYSYKVRAYGTGNTFTDSAVI